jgi:hypothetical protein
MALPGNFLQDLIASTQGGNVEPQQQPNFLAQILGGQPGQMPTAGGMTQQQAGPPPMAAQQAPGRPRKSVLDMIGGLADVFASVGGAAPLYQQGLDAQLGRQNAAEDRTREIDMEALRKQVIENQIQSGEQNLEAGELDIQNARNEMLGSAGAGLRQIMSRGGPEGVAKVWPLVAQQLGISPEQTAQIGEAFGADPQGTLDALFPDPTIAKGGSKSKEIQIYELLAANNPETANAYLNSLAAGGGEKPMTAYQREQVRLAEGRLGLARERYENPPASATERAATTKQEVANAQKEQATNGALTFLDTLEETVTALNESGGMTNEQQGTVGTLGTAAREYLPLVERVASPEGFAARERLDGLLTQGVSSLLPLLTGMTIGSKNMDAAKEMENLKRAVVSAKSYEAAMAAINSYRANLRQQVRARQAAPVRQGAPSRRPGAPQRKPVPVTRVINGKRYEQRGGKWFEAQ